MSDTMKTAIEHAHEAIDRLEYLALARAENATDRNDAKAAAASARAAINALRPAPKLTEEERPIWGVWVDYNHAPPGSYACLVSSFVNGQWAEPDARWMPAHGRPHIQGQVRVMPHLMPGDPLTRAAKET